MSNFQIASGLIVAFFAMSFDAIATVNPLDQSLSETHVDFSGTSFSLSRNFHSDRSQIGVFGKGWCSIWESKLIVQGDSAQFIFCGAGKVYDFNRSGDRWKSKDPSYSLSSNKSGFEMTVAQRSSFSFQPDGKLRSLVMAGQKIHVEYSDGNIHSIKSGKDSLRFLYLGGQLDKVLIGKQPINYIFNKDFLKSVVVSGKVIYSYQYDGHGQLVAIEYPDGPIKYSYDGKKVSTIRYGNCEEKIRLGKNVSVQKKCNGKTSVATFSSRGKDRSEGLVVLETSGKEKIQRIWKNHRLVEVQRNKNVEKLSYDNNGLVKEVLGPSYKMTVAERTQGLPNRILFEKRGPQRQPAQTLNVRWSNGQMTKMDMGDFRVDIQELADSTVFSNSEYKITLSKNGTTAGGVWKGRKVPLFKIRGDANSYSPDQLLILGALATIGDLKQNVENL